MKKIILATAIAVAFGSPYVFAHHPAEGTVDEEIWDMIDENVADSPHSDMDIGGDMGGILNSPEPGMDSDLGSGNSGSEGARNAANR